MRTYRYPGVQPFSSEYQHVFFGRKEDVDQLYQLIRQQQLVVLHAPSGVGKTSLLQAGILPRIQEADDFQPVFIQFSAWTNQQTETLPDIVRRQWLQQYPMEDGPGTKEGRLDDRAQTQIDQAENGLPVLIFDQFEALFSYPENQIQALKEEMVSLLQPAYSKAIQQGQDVFSDSASGDDETFQQEPALVKMVIAIPSHQLDLLDQWADDLPDLLHHRYELKALNTFAARAAIVEPALKKGDFLSPPFHYEEEAMAKVLHFLENEEDRVEPAQLQILCRSFEENVRQNKLELLTKEKMGDLEEVLAEYYHEQINQLDGPEERRTAQQLVEEGLVADEGRQRISIHEAQVISFFRAKPALLKQLIDRHLIRAKPGKMYWLLHDNLIAPVLAAKRLRKEKEIRMTEELVRVNREREANLMRQQEEEKRQRMVKEHWLKDEIEDARDEAENYRRKARRFAAIGFLLTALAIYAAGFVFYQNAVVKRAQVQSNEAEELAQFTRLNAETTLQAARREKQRVEKALVLAQENQRQAEIEKETALAALQRSEQARRTAARNEQRAQVNLLLAKADQAADRPDEQHQMLGYLHLVWQKEPDRPEIQQTMYKNVPSFVIPASLAPDSTSVLGDSLNHNTVSPSDQQEVAMERTDSAGVDTLMSDSTTYVVRDWTPKGGAVGIRSDHQGTIRFARFSPVYGQAISVSADGRGIIWDIATGKSMGVLQGHSDGINTGYFSPDGTGFLTASEDGTAILWDIKTQKVNQRLEGHQKGVHAAVFSHDGKWVATASKDSTIRIWERTTGKFVREIKHPGSCTSVFFSNDDTRLLSTADDGIARLWDVGTGQLVREIGLDEGHIDLACFSPDGGHLLTISQGSLQLRSPNGKLLRQVIAHTAPIRYAEFSPSGKRIVTASDDFSAKLWNIQLNELSTLKGHSGKVTSAGFTSDGRKVLTSSTDGSIRVWITSPYAVFRHDPRRLFTPLSNEQKKRLNIRW